MYVVLAECKCKLEGRVSMLHGMGAEDMHNFLFSLSAPRMLAFLSFVQLVNGKLNCPFRTDMVIGFKIMQIIKKKGILNSILHFTTRLHEIKRNRGNYIY